MADLASTTTPPFDLPGIRRRIKRRLQDLAGKFFVEALHVYQKRVPLKVDEIKAYGAAMHLAAMAVGEAKAALEKVEKRLAKSHHR